MNWRHEVDPEWLEARRRYLSASDMEKLIPITPTGRKRANIANAVLKVWASKQCSITEDMVKSSGAMARGHLLEPYAIDEFNRLSIMPTLHHWDDALVRSSDGLVSTSPDALDVVQIPGKIEYESIEAKFLGEVKAYNADKHYEISMAPSPTLEERWQIATAFYVIKTLEQAALILFNPSAEHPLFYHVYSKQSLKNEIGMIEQVAKDYAARSKSFEKIADTLCQIDKDSCISEDQIIENIKAAEAGVLNP